MAWQDRHAIPAFRRQREEDRVQRQYEIHRRPCLEKTNKESRKNPTQMFQKCILM
jgi:hypothetical protein